MLRKIRIILASVCFVLLTLLFLDFTGVLHHYLGWLAKIQLLPAVLALNVAVIVLLVLLTLLLGRVYCSVICPLGIMQDLFAWAGRKQKKNRYSWSPAKTVLRWTVWGVFVLVLILGVGSAVALLDPYAAYGRIAQNLLSPLWRWGNNLLALIAERAGSYAFYPVDVYLKSLPTFLIAVVTLGALIYLAWHHGRTYCNTICPVGTTLGFLSRFSWMRPIIDKDKCIGCKLCEKNCKAACIHIDDQSIDYSRCVVCMDCIEKCSKQAISYGPRPFGKKAPAAANKAKTESNASARSDKDGMGRREFLTLTAALTGTALLEAQSKTVDGGLAVITDKKAPHRQTPIVPPGALGIRHLAKHCTGCQLCVSACPTHVLRPSTDLQHLMQPVSSYEKGYCRPECTRCSEVCPAGAIQPISRAEKSSIQIGHAVWVKENCIPLTNGDSCGHCAEVCPVGAITMVRHESGVRVPAVNDARCIGCGACENLCPARPFSAIYVEGHELHKNL